MRERGFSVEIFDGTFSDGIDDFAAKLAESCPRVVGITAVQPNRETALNLAEIAHNAGATVILGGPDPTSNPEVYLQNHVVDIIVHHEGELTLVELLGTLLVRESYQPKIKTIEGIAYRDLQRVFCPVGMPVKARSDTEIAISIVAELIRARHCS